MVLNFPKLTQEDITKQMLEFVSNNKHLTNLSHCNLRRWVEAKHLCETQTSGQILSDRHL